MFKYISLLLCMIFLLSVLGCHIDLTEQGQKDRALADKVNERLKTRKSIYGDVLGDVKYDRNNLGHYTFKFRKTDLTAQEVNDWTFKLLVVVQEQNDTVVMTGRSLISVSGYMGREKVVSGTYASGPQLTPIKVTLEGKYAGEDVREGTLKGVRGGGLEE